MPIAQNHADWVSGLARMAALECEGDAVAAFASLIDAATALALSAGIDHATAQDRLAQNFRLVKRSE